jgi:alkylhydroperoxidase/carboxymuconolactone decarboxylase family protein YurZ
MIEERKVVTMDSARYVDGRNTGTDVVVAASYLGILPARLIAPHQPRGVIGHDANVGKDGAGISGLGYLEALGIPAATAAGDTAELGDGRDLYEAGVISYVNVLAERCGVTVGMPVREAAEVLLTKDPGDVDPGNKIRREVVETADDGASIVVTDSIVFALPEDHGRNVLVTAGHTGKSGATFLLEVNPRGFICSDGGKGKNDAGIAGLAITGRAGVPGATADAWSAPIGDAFAAWQTGVISACNEPAAAVGVRVGQTVQEAARRLLAGVKVGSAEAAGRAAQRDRLASPLLRDGSLAAVSAKFAEGLSRVREVTDLDGALPAWAKATFMAAAASVKGHPALARRELARAARNGLTASVAAGAGIAVLISRGEGVYEGFRAIVDDVFGARAAPRNPIVDGGFDASAETAREYFDRYFGFVPDYILLMAERSPRALEGYMLMREWALAENTLEPKLVELILCTVNAAEFESRFVDIHACGARRAGASEEEIVEAVICAIPVAGVASWLPGADGVNANR